MRHGIDDKIFFFAGTWDLFHIEHLNALHKARAIAGKSKLIVAVVTDEHCLQYKKHYPSIPYEQRNKFIRALNIADAVVPQCKQFDIEQMRLYGVTTVFMGENWQRQMPDILKELMQVVEVIFLPIVPGISTTIIRERVSTQCQST